MRAVFQFVAQDDVQWIGEFVRVHANEAALYAGGQLEEIRGLPLRGSALRTQELALDDRCGEIEERGTAAHLHFHRQGLALVQGHAAGDSNRLAAPRRRQTLLVEGMTRFVEHREHGFQKVVFVVAGGDAGVVGLATAEGMMADV